MSSPTSKQKSPALAPVTATHASSKHKKDHHSLRYRESPRFDHMPRPHGVFFVDTLAGEDEVDLLYSYPRTPTKDASHAEHHNAALAHTPALTNMKGVYVACKRIMESLTGQEIQTVSMGYHPEGASPLSDSGTYFEHFNPELVTIRVGMRVLEDVMFAVVLPADIAHESIVRALVHDLLAYILYLHDTLESIFPERLLNRANGGSARSGQSSDADNVSNTADARAKLDHIFKRFFKQVFQQGSDLQHQLFTYAFYGGVPYFPVHPDIQYTLGQTVGKLMAGEFRVPAEAISLDPYSDIPIGACIFHKGLLVHSQLPRHELIEVTRFAEHNALFERTAATSQLESWRDVYSTIEEPHSGRRYRERRQLTVVGHGCTVLLYLTVLADPSTDVEAGLPDPHHIEEVKLCLHELRSARVFQDIDNDVLHAVPPTIDDDPGRLGSAMSQVGASRVAASTITAGPRNVLFHYVSTNHLVGFLLTPINSPRINFRRPTLLHRFLNAAAAIRTQFRLFLEMHHHSLEPPQLATVDPVSQAKEREDTAWEGSVSSAPKSTKGQELDIHTFQGVDGSSPFASTGAEALTLVHEIGMALTSNDMNEDGFWVVGRMFAPDREFYVCYHGSIPQSVTEMAFKLNFGKLV